MGVYIKGATKPTSCGECFIGTRYMCEHVESFEDCPMTEVKEPHGRLIDEDEVLDTVKRLKSFPWGDDRGNRIPLLFEPYEVERVIKQSPTVIEGSKD